MLKKEKIHIFFKDHKFTFVKMSHPGSFKCIFQWHPTRVSCEKENYSNSCPPKPCSNDTIFLTQDISIQRFGYFCEEIPPWHIPLKPAGQTTTEKCAKRC